MEEKRTVGRPTKYDPSFINMVDEYLATTGKAKMHLPKISSFALFLGVNPDTLYEWGKQYPEFSESLAKIKTRQEEQLIDDGIYGGKEVNSTIVKLVLSHNHGYKERTENTGDGNPLVFSLLNQSVINEQIRKVYGEKENDNNISPDSSLQEDFKNV